MGLRSVPFLQLIDFFPDEKKFLQCILYDQQTRLFASYFPLPADDGHLSIPILQMILPVDQSELRIALSVGLPELPRISAHLTDAALIQHS